MIPRLPESVSDPEDSMILTDLSEYFNHGEDEMERNDEGFEFVSRYGTGPGPDPATMCDGQCEGMGRYPQRLDDPNLTQYEREQWRLEHAREPHECDGTHFIVCPDCGGTGDDPK